MADKLETEVRAVLADEVADVTASPALLAAVRRRYRRRVLVRRLGLAAPVLAAAVVATLVVTQTAQPVVQAGPTATAVPEPANAAYVRQHVTEALDDVAEDISYERAVITGAEKYGDPGLPALYERWRPGDGSCFRLLVSRDGVPLSDLSYDRVAYVDVNYRTRTYVAREGMDMNSGVHNDVWTPREIQQELARDGAVSVIGPGEQLGGRATVKLHVSELKADTTMTLWVDATTYLPVRWQYDQDASTPYDITWLPPTAENQAKLTAPVPAGFERKDSY